VILGDLSKGSASGKGPSATLDDLFRRTVLRRPNDIALVDPPNRASFTHGAPYRLTYAEADRAVSALARRLRRMGLATDTVLGIQLPNTVESVLMLLAALRAGMIAAPLPLLWRRLEVIAALSRIGAKGLITCGHVGTTNHCELAMHIAAESFPIRYVCAFGPDLPDGVVSLDELQADDARAIRPRMSLSLHST
jgi:acyl-CoA synthetase (AMP-forming)/AMP-acid ligase II